MARSYWKRLAAAVAQEADVITYEARIARQWDMQHINPRVSYYLFLRRVYGMHADEALRHVNRAFPPTVKQIQDALTRR